MSTLAAEYLPPLVTKLIGDNSDLLAATAEAEAALKAFGKTSTKASEEAGAGWRKSGKDMDEFTDLVVRRARKGETAVQTLRRELKRTGDEVETLRKRLRKDTANQGLFSDFKKATGELSKLRKLAQEIAPDLIDAGHQGGKGFLTGFIEVFSTMGEYAIPILIGMVVLASPMIAALIGSAVVVGLGLGFAGIGALLAALLLPKVKKSFEKIATTGKQALTYAVSGAFDNGLLKALSIFKRFIPRFGRQLREIFDSIGPMLPSLSLNIGKGIGNLLEGISTALKNITTNGSLQTFFDTIPMVMQALGDFLVKITQNGPALSRFISDAASAVAGFLEGAGDVIAWLEGVYLWVARVNEKFPFTRWSSDVKWIKGVLKSLGDFFTGLWDSIVAGVESVGRWFADLGASIWDWLKGAGSNIADFVTGVVDWFQELPGRIAAFFSALPGRVAGFVSRMAHRVAYLIGWMVGRWVRFMLELPGKVLAVISYVWAWTTRKTNEAVTAVIDEVKALPGQIGRFFSMIWTAVSTWVVKTWRSVVLWFERTKLSIIEHVATAVTAAIAFFKGLPGRAATELKKFKDRVLTFFTDAKKWLFDAGKNIVLGIWEGVQSLAGWVVDKVKSLAHDIVKGFKDAIGSHSPATAFIDPGVDSVRGYVVGVMKALPQVQSAWRQMMSGLPSPAYAGGVTPAMAATIGAGPAGAPRGGPSSIDNRLYIDGREVVRVITPVAQRRKARSGTTGLS